jgi:hypothetical protein
MSSSTLKFRLPKQSKHKRIKVFPSLESELETRGCYDNRALQITILEYKAEEIRKAFDAPEKYPLLTINVHPLVAHEVAHWMDHVGTLWGRNLILQQAKAIEARRSLNEYSFTKIIQYYEACRSLNLPEYYLHLPDIENENFGKPWVWRLSVGVAFDNLGTPNEGKPIVFTQFFDPQNNKLICRAPFSLASLHESTAMHCEITVLKSLVTKFKGKTYDQYAIDKLNGITSNLYERLFVLYTVSAHYSANVIGISDANNAYEYAYNVAEFCFNLPDQYFDQLCIPEGTFAWPKRTPSLWEARTQTLLKNKDRGFLYVLVFTLIAQSKKSQIRETLEEVCERLGLPELNELEKEVDELFSHHITRLPPIDEYDNMAWHLKSGHKLYQERGLIGDKICVSDLVNKATIPPMRTKDDYFYTPSDLTTNFCNEWGRKESDYFKVNNQMDEFVDACY